MHLYPLDPNTSCLSYKDTSTLNESTINKSNLLPDISHHRRYQTIIDNIRNHKSDNVFQSTGLEPIQQKHLKKNLMDKKLKNRNYLPNIKAKMIKYPKGGKSKVRSRTIDQEEQMENSKSVERWGKLRKLKAQKHPTEENIDNIRQRRHNTQNSPQQPSNSQLLNNQLKYFGQYLKSTNDKSNRANITVQSKSWKKTNTLLPKAFQLYTQIINKYNENSKFLIKGQSITYLPPHPIYHLSFYQTHMPNNPNFHLRFVKAFFKDGKEPFSFNKFEMFYEIFMKNNLKQLDVPTFIFDFFTYEANSESCILKSSFNDTLRMLVDNSLRQSHSEAKTNDIYEYIRNQIERKIQEKETTAQPQFIEKQILKEIILDNPEISFILFVMMMRREG